MKRILCCLGMDTARMDREIKGCMGVTKVGNWLFLDFYCVFCFKNGRFFYIRSRKWTAFVLENLYFHQTFTVCVSNQYSHFYSLELSSSNEMPLASVAFKKISYIIDGYSCLNCCIFTNLSPDCGISVNLHNLIPISIC